MLTPTPKYRRRGGGGTVRREIASERVKIGNRRRAAPCRGTGAGGRGECTWPGAYSLRRPLLRNAGRNRVLATDPRPGPPDSGEFHRPSGLGLPEFRSRSSPAHKLWATTPRKPVGIVGGPHRQLAAPRSPPLVLVDGSPEPPHLRESLRKADARCRGSQPAALPASSRHLLGRENGRLLQAGPVYQMGCIADVVCLVGAVGSCRSMTRTRIRGRYALRLAVASCLGWML
jgi:hypothetical protein